MKRCNLVLIAWLLGVALLVETIVLLAINPIGHIVCVTSILIAVAFGILVGFLLESHQTNAKSKQIVHYRKPSKIDSKQEVEHLVPENKNNASDGATTAPDAE